MISIAYGIKKTFCRSLFHPLMNPAFSTEGLLFFTHIYYVRILFDEPDLFADDFDLLIFLFIRPLFSNFFNEEETCDFVDFLILTISAAVL